MDGFPSNLLQYIIVTSLRANSILMMTLTLFSRSLSCFGISFEPVDGFSSNLHLYITVTVYRADKVIVLYVAYLLNKWMNSFFFLDISLQQAIELTRFW